MNPNDLPDELGGINTPWNPALAGLPNVSSQFQLVQFIKDVYLDSQVTIGVISNNNSAAVPDVGGNRPPRNITESEAGQFLTAQQTAAVRNFVNQIAGSTRMLAHGQLYPGKGNTRDPVYGDFTQWQIDNLHPDSWKGYNIVTAEQWQIEALWRFQIPEDLQQQYGYPALTEASRRKILGLNSARLYKLPAAAQGQADGHEHGLYKPVPANYESLITDDLKRILEFPGFTAADDKLWRFRKQYLARGGERDNTRYGWIRKAA